MAVRQTSCRYCGQDIENFAPYRKGQWRDRGNNSTCPTKAGDRGLLHAPYIEGWRIKLCRECRGPIDRRTLSAGGEVCYDCATA